MYRTGDERSMFGEKMLTPGPGIACTHEQSSVLCDRPKCRLCDPLPSGAANTSATTMQSCTRRRAKVGASASRLLKNPPGPARPAPRRTGPVFQDPASVPPGKFAVRDRVGSGRLVRRDDEE